MLSKFPFKDKDVLFVTQTCSRNFILQARLINSLGILSAMFTNLSILFSGSSEIQPCTSSFDNNDHIITTQDATHKTPLTKTYAVYSKIFSFLLHNSYITFPPMTLHQNIGYTGTEASV